MERPLLLIPALAIGILLACILPGCSKDKLISKPPQEPGAYLPVYPGSHWTYQRTSYSLTDTLIDTIREESPPEYILHYLLNSQGTDSTANYVPYWKGVPLYKYSFPAASHDHPSSGTAGHKLVDHLSETVPYTSNHFHNQYASSFIYVAAKGISLTVGPVTYPDVIKVDHYYEYMTYGECITLSRFYARNVGLVKEIRFPLYSTDTAAVINLIDYHINN